MEEGMEVKEGLGSAPGRETGRAKQDCIFPLFRVCFPPLFGGLGGKEIGEPQYDGGALHAIRAEDCWPRTGFRENIVENSCRHRDSSGLNM